MRITVDRVIGDDVKLSWVFDLHTDMGGRITLILENYTRYMRPTKRHNWKPEALYSRINYQGTKKEREGLNRKNL